MLWVFLILAGGPSAALGQTTPTPAPPLEEDVDQNYTSVHVTVYSKDLLENQQRDWDLELKLKAAGSVYKYETIDDFLNPEIDHLQSVGVRPKLEFGFPLPINNVSFVPEVELAWHYVFDEHRGRLSGSAAAGLQYLRPGEQYDFLTKAEIKYGTRYVEDGQNLDDFVELSLEARWINAIRIGKGERILTLSPLVKYSEFIDDLEFIAEGGTPFDIARKYEVGLLFSTLPRLRIGSVKLPELRISYVFGDDFTGIQIRL